MAKASSTLAPVTGPAMTAAGFSMPKWEAIRGTPPPKIIKAALTVIPRNPQTTARYDQCKTFRQVNAGPDPAAEHLSHGCQHCKLDEACSEGPVGAEPDKKFI